MITPPPPSPLRLALATHRHPAPTSQSFPVPSLPLAPSHSLCLPADSPHNFLSTCWFALQIPSRHLPQSITAPFLPCRYPSTLVLYSGHKTYPARSINLKIRPVEMRAQRAGTQPFRNPNAQTHTIFSPTPSSRPHHLLSHTIFSPTPSTVS